MKKLLFLILVVSSFMAACDRDDSNQATTAPTASAKGVAKFEITNPNENVLEGTKMQLRNDSENAVIYRWDFGTGQISTEREPSYLYPSCGSYMLTLTIKDKAGHTETVSKAVHVTCTKPAHANYQHDGLRN